MFFYAEKLKVFDYYKSKLSNIIVKNIDRIYLKLYNGKSVYYKKILYQKRSVGGS